MIWLPKSLTRLVPVDHMGAMPERTGQTVVFKLKRLQSP